MGNHVRTNMKLSLESNVEVNLATHNFLMMIDEVPCTLGNSAVKIHIEDDCSCLILYEEELKISYCTALLRNCTVRIDCTEEKKKPKICRFWWKGSAYCGTKMLVGAFKSSV